MRLSPKQAEYGTCRHGQHKIGIQSSTAPTTVSRINAARIPIMRISKAKPTGPIRPT